MNMNEPATQRIYDVWSKFYDHVFGRLVRKRQIRAAQQLHAQPGDRILELGVGTGMLLDHYRRDAVVVGLDLSKGMLRKAALRREKLGLDDCHLMVADAMRPPFADNSFDHVMLSHTISVVSDPAALMKLAARLVKPGGRIVLLNHFRSNNPVMAWGERVLNPLFLKLGWKSDLELEEILRGVDARLDYRFKLSRWDIWQIVVLTRLDRRDGARPTAKAADEPAAVDSGVLVMDGQR